MQNTNRLAHEKSPYLLQHAHNPVDWQPWGEEAFAQARAEDKPIFLSIGYSTCHWCHVMAHESFEDQATADVMNTLFVNVKVDREERPDVDRVYMTFVQATTGGGGWPLSVWLQPDLTPIVGGTYFPPGDQYGRRGFVPVCQSVAEAWKDERPRVVAQGERILTALRAHTAAEEPSIRTDIPEPRPIVETMRQALRPLVAAHDAEWGGFGDAPKFPRPVTLELLARICAHLETAAPTESLQARDILLATLRHMAAGGIHDHLGGGFHRYSVDRFWHVPHFEKMLYDQAQIAVVSLEAFQITGDPSYAEIARDILEYVARDLTSPEGGFFCAEDADSLLSASSQEHAEGAFYVWTKAEIEQVLTPAESDVFCAHYGVEAGGNTPPGSDPQGEFVGKNILFAADGAVEPADAVLLATARGKLLDERAHRPRPHLDDKILTGWNGLMISAFARASQVLGERSYLDAATHAAAFVRQHLFRAQDGVLLRSYRQGAGTVEGFADDYAFLICGLLDLYEAGFDYWHVEWAEELQTKQDELFADPAGGYFASRAHDPQVLLRLKEDQDNAEPAASSVSAHNLARLAALTGREDFLRHAEQTVAAFGAARDPARAAQAMPLMLAALDLLAQPPLQIVVVGAREGADTLALLRVIRDRFLPHAVVLLIDGEEDRRRLVRRLPYLESATRLEGRATAYLCADGACQLPVTDPAALARRFANQNGA